MGKIYFQKPIKMKSNLKASFSVVFFSAQLLFLGTTYSQSDDCSSPIEVKDKTEKTSGCSPSSCRGSQTKFGEAKVITDLRANLIGLKSDMEKSNTIFDARAYDIHGIVGKTDDESLEIIVREIKIIEKEFSNKTNFKLVALSLPESKAQQIAYLENRLHTLKKFL